MEGIKMLLIISSGLCCCTATLERFTAMETKTCALTLRVGKEVFCFVLILHKLEHLASKKCIRV